MLPTPRPPRPPARVDLMLGVPLVGGLLLGGLGCERGDLSHSAAYQGVVEFDETRLAFEVGGRITKLDVREGDEVKAAQPLATLDDTLARTEREARAMEAAALRAQVDLANAGARKEDITAMGARVRAAKATEALLTKQVARQRSLRERGVATDALLDDLEGQLARATAERQSLDAQLDAMRRGTRPEEKETVLRRAEAADAAIKLADERLARHTLSAPGAGTVLEVPVEPGEVVAAGAPVVVLGNTARPYVDVFVPEGRTAGIREGTRATVRTDAHPEALAGAVEYVSRTTEFTPRYLFSERERPTLVVRVRVRVEDPKRELHAGVPAFVDFAQSTARP